jgi:hypothetical protein
MIAGPETQTTRMRRTAPAGSPRSRPRQGWWGVLFAGLLLISEGAVALPRTSHTTAFISHYYGEHRLVITVGQVGQLVATALLLLFLRALVDQAAPATRRWVAVTGAAVAGVSVLTNVPVLALALRPGLSAASTRSLATWTDLTDIGLFITICAFGIACLFAFTPLWLRVSAAAVAVLSIVHAGLSVGHVPTLEGVAPSAFVAFILALALRMLRGPARTT